MVDLPPELWKCSSLGEGEKIYENPWLSAAIRTLLLLVAPSSMPSALGRLEGELADMLHPTEKQNGNSSGARQCLWGGREDGELMWAVCSNKGSHHRSMCWLDRSKCSHLTWLWQLKWERCFATPKKGGYEGRQGKARGHHSCPPFRNIPDSCPDCPDSSPQP